MSVVNMKSSTSSSRLVDFVVVTLSFLMFALSTGWLASHPFMISLLIYVPVVLVSLRLSKRIIFQRFQNLQRVLIVLLGNFCGLLLGSLFVIITGELLPSLEINNVLVVFSSLMAFFILGTLSPMVKSSRHDIIPH